MSCGRRLRSSYKAHWMTQRFGTTEWLAMYERRILLASKTRLTPAELEEYQLLCTLVDAYIEWCLEKGIGRDPRQRFMDDFGKMN